MTDAEKLEYLQTLTGSSASDDFLTLCLDIAENAILLKLYPMSTDRSEKTVPDIYSFQQIRIAQYLVNNKDSLGLLLHTEQGITDQFASAAAVPPDLLADVIPFATVPSKIVG